MVACIDSLNRVCSLMRPAFMETYPRSRAMDNSVPFHPSVHGTHFRCAARHDVHHAVSRSKRLKLYYYW